jgi:hypothetical protein
MRLTVLPAIIALGGITSVAAAKDFKNLDFELGLVQAPPSGNVPFDAIGPISAAAALPGWTVKEDSTTCTQVWGGNGFDETSVTLNTPSLHNGTPISGNFSVTLESQAAASAPYYRTSSISQTGFIPSDALYLRFSIRPIFTTAPTIPYVSIGGTNIPVSKISTTGDVQTWTGDISAFAGFDWQLTFSAIGLSGYDFHDPRSEDYFMLDNISFQSPEPTTLSAVAVPLAALLLRRQRKSRAEELKCGLNPCDRDANVR